MKQFCRKLLVVTLPALMIYAWAGCIILCSEESGSPAVISAGVTTENCAAPPAECGRDCPGTDRAAAAERQNVHTQVYKRDAAIRAGEPVTQNLIPAPRGLTCLGSPFPKVIPLKARPGNLRI